MKNGCYAKTPTVLQMESSECGAASLAMILGFYGRNIPLEQMRLETDVSRDGATALNIKRAALRLGLNCSAFTKSTEELRQQDMPCIIHWNFYHYVVLEGFKGKYAYINDPAFGRRKLTINELDEGFSGVVLTFSKADSFFKTKKKRNNLIKIVKRLHGHTSSIFQLFYVGLLLVFPGITLSVLAQVFMDDVLASGYTDWTVRILVFMGSTLTLRFALSYYHSLLLQKVKSSLMINSCKAFLNRLFSLPISFFEQRYPGDLLNRVNSDSKISEFVAADLVQMALNIITAVFYLIVLFLYNPIMTLIGLCGMVFCLLSVIISSTTITNDMIKLRMREEKLFGAVAAGIESVNTIKASGLERNYSNKLLNLQAQSATLEQKINRFEQLTELVTDSIDKVTEILLLISGGYMVIYGQMTMGMLIAFQSLFDLFAKPTNELFSYVTSLKEMKSHMDRIADLETYPKDEHCSISDKPSVFPQKMKGEVTLTNITFGYSLTKPPCIRNLSIQLKAGHSLAVVGSSGCGKSTLAKLISGLYEPWDGQIDFDGIPRNRIPIEIIQSSISVVDQKITLFSGTIRDNITMWRNISENDVWDAVRDACIDGLVSDLGGLDGELDQDGNNLSGGQRQRLEIARALATNPTLLVFDEATSALDPITEMHVMQNIRKRGCTCLIVAHRLSTIRDCDQIIVLNKGTIVQSGTHDELFNVEGLYRAFVQSE